MGHIFLLMMVCCSDTDDSDVCVEASDEERSDDECSWDSLDSFEGGECECELDYDYDECGNIISTGRPSSTTRPTEPQACVPPTGGASGTTGGIGGTTGGATGGGATGGGATGGGATGGGATGGGATGGGGMITDGGGTGEDREEETGLGDSGMITDSEEEKEDEGGMNTEEGMDELEEDPDPCSQFLNDREQGVLTLNIQEPNEGSGLLYRLINEWREEAVNLNRVQWSKYLYFSAFHTSTFNFETWVEGGPDIKAWDDVNFPGEDEVGLTNQSEYYGFFSGGDVRVGIRSFSIRMGGPNATADVVYAGLRDEQKGKSDRETLFVGIANVDRHWTIIYSGANACSLGVPKFWKDE